MGESLFEWDETKAEANLRKHGVGFEEASEVFGDPLAELFEDPEHSDGEHRLKTLGRCASGTVLCVVHADRDGRIHIISARSATAREVRLYERGT